MGAGLLLTIGTLLYMILLAIVYFTKKKINSIENGIFSKIIVTNIIGVSLHLILYLLMEYVGVTNMLTLLVSKLYLIYLVTFMMLFTDYVLIITNKDKEKMIKKYPRIIGISVILACLLAIVIFNLPIEFHNEPGKMYTYGKSVYVIYCVGFITISLNIICLLTNMKEIMNKKYYPIIFYLLLGLVTSIIQFKYPYVQLITAKDSFIIFLMYFTIENPDVKLIKELTYSKEMLERANDLTLTSLNTLSVNISASLRKLFNFGNKNIDTNNIPDLIDEVHSVQKLSLDLVDEIGGIIDLTKIESGKYSIVESNYNLKEKVDNLIRLFNLKKGNKNIKLKTLINKDIPNILYGDVTKIQETLLYIYQTLLGSFEEGTITFKLDYLKVGTLCRLIYCITVPYDKVKNSIIFNDFGNNEQVAINNLDYKIFNKLIQLLNIRYETKINDKKTVEFIIKIDQRIMEEYEVDDIQEEKKYLVKPFDSKGRRVLIVAHDRENIKRIAGMLEKYNLDINVAHSNEEFNLILYGNKTWDLVIIDDMMINKNEFIYLQLDNLQKRYMYESVEKMAGYKIQIVMMITKNKEKIEEKYLKAGFDYIIKPINDKKLDDILVKYLKK